MAAITRQGRHALGDWQLRSGGVLRDARLGYAIWGRANNDADNIIVLPSYYTGNHDSYAPLIGPGNVFDTDRYCVVGLDLFGNGVSTSPSNAAPSQTGPAFPPISLRDAVAAQYHFLRHGLGAPQIALVAGWSLGGMQAYQWAADYPDYVRRIMPWCATAHCCDPNRAFLYSVRAALEADPGLDTGDAAMGLRAFGRVYAGWAYSGDYFRRQAWREDGYSSLEALFAAWEAEHRAWDAHDLLSKLDTWLDACLDANDEAELTARLAGIRARTVSLPCAHDAYFTPADAAWEMTHLANGRCDVVDSIWGHVAGGPGRHQRYREALKRATNELLADFTDGESRP